ncbi:hypothetical protein GGQ02_003110 [Salinibacter ruber]|uniref:hypothetical protein n=1 Tax=Salinibacter ruber TaxID=146919 RepID=UPI0021694462|nr:hypothetical protein [Salinibacter ruber]MCS4034700.1 hypothetical protein [Salinibacter ruber]
MGQDYVGLLTGAGDYQQKGELSPPPEEQIGIAKTVIDNFGVVGVLEEIDEFQNRIRRLGWPIDIGHENKNPVSKEKQRKRVSDQVLSRIQEVCGPNIEIYQYVREGHT